MTFTLTRISAAKIRRGRHDASLPPLRRSPIVFVAAVMAALSVSFAHDTPSPARAQRAFVSRLSRFLLLAVALLTLSVLSIFGDAAPAQAQTTDYDSDDDGLIGVSSLAQLNAIRWDLDGDGSASDAGYATAFPNPATGMGCPTSGCVGYELTANLDFDTNGSGGADDGDDYWNSGHGWLPIGIDSDPFSAIFEGNGRVISNLYIDTGPKRQSDATGVPVSGLSPAHFGLFEEVSATGAIRNVGLEDVDVSREHGCHSRPQIICNQGRVGGLAGVNHGKISGSWVTGAVSNIANGGAQMWNSWRARGHYHRNTALAAGGLAGFAGSSSVISNSYSAAAVYVYADWIRVRIKGGGLAGHNGGSIIASYAMGEVYSDRRSTSSYDSGLVGHIGGLVGHNSGPITASYARGAVSGPPQFRVRSGLVGYGNGSPTITASYWDTVASGQSESHAGVGRTTAQLQAPTGYSGIYANWNVDLDGDGSGDDPWAFGTASQYPVLKSLGVTKQRGLTPGSVPRVDYDSDDDGLIEISRNSQLLMARADPDGDGAPSISPKNFWHIEYYNNGFLRSADGMGCPQTGCVGHELVSDLNMGGVIWNSNLGSYSAIFEGNGHTIVGLGYGPMFGQISASGVVRNLTLKSSNAYITERGRIGGLAAANHGAISNVHVSGSASTTAGVGGGLVGLNGPTGIIADSSSAGQVRYSATDQGRDIGGLVGRNAGSIRSSWSTARAGGQSTSNIGGLVGYNASTGSIRGSYARGEVWNKYIHIWGNPLGRNLGGLVGTNEGEITASYSTGRVSGGKVMGGLVGRNTFGSITNSYYDTRASGQTTSAGGVGRTKEQLQQPWKAAYEGIYASWNLDLDGDDSPDDPWDFGAPDRYPKLKSPKQRQQFVKTFILTPKVRFLEGRSTKLSINLNRPAPTGGVEFAVTPSFNNAALMNEVMSIASPVTVAAGDTTADITVFHTPNDRLDEPDKSFTLTVAANTAGWRKAGDGWDTATITVGDDDVFGLRFERTVWGGRLGEPSVRIAEGGTGTYRLSMASRILANVTVTVTSDDPGAVTVSPESYTFTPSNWDTLKTFTVTGVADADADDEIVTVRHWLTKQGATNSRFAGLHIVAVSDPTSPQQQPQQSLQPQQKAPGDYADLIAQVRQWRNDPNGVNNKSHRDRWDRALLAFGETVADATLTPMTAAEAQDMASRYMPSRWNPVVEALREIEAAREQQQQSQQEPSNQAPAVSASIGDATIVSASGTKQVSLSGVFSDADNDALTVTAASSDEAVGTVSVASDGSSLTVTAKSRGSATITLTADDGNGGTVDDSFIVTVKSAPVVASAIADVSGLAAGATQEVSLSGVFSDADGDNLTMTAASSDETKGTVSVSADYSTLTLTGVAEGTATVTVTAQDSDGNRVSDAFEAPVARKYNALISQMYQWREDPQWRHQKSHTDRWDRALLAFGETVSDTTLTAMTAAEAQALADQDWGERWVPVAAALWEIEGGGQQEQVTPNQAPTVAAALGDVTIVNESGTRTLSLSGVFHDADGDSLTITAASSDDAVATELVASDGSNLTARARARGTATITVTASDGNGGTVEDSFTVTVKAAPVVSSTIADVSGLEVGSSQDVSLSGVFSDADADALTVTAASGAQGIATVTVATDYSTLTLTGVAEGTATITVTARDTDGNRVSDAFDVSVTTPEPEPTPTLDPTPTPAPEPETETETSDIVARYDADGDGRIVQEEMRQALDDFYAGRITQLELIEIHEAYAASYG